MQTSCQVTLVASTVYLYMSRNLSHRIGLAFTCTFIFQTNKIRNPTSTTVAREQLTGRLRGRSLIT